MTPAYCSFLEKAVDMRWGIQSGATNDHSASNLCMAELKNCQEQSLGPNFVVSGIKLLKIAANL